MTSRARGSSPKKETPNRQGNEPGSVTSSTAKTVVGRPGPHDVLMGRGAPVTEHEGNTRLRQLVIDRHSAYAAPQIKRGDKQRVAMSIVQTVRKRGGRFLRRLQTVSDEEPQQEQPQKTSERSSAKSFVWEVVTDEQEIIRKIKQLLRDMGPEARERRAVRHTLRRKNPPKESKRSSRFDHSSATLSSPGSSTPVHSVHAHNSISLPPGMGDLSNFAGSIAQSTLQSPPLSFANVNNSHNSSRDLGLDMSALRVAPSGLDRTRELLLQSLIARTSATATANDVFSHASTDSLSVAATPTTSTSTSSSDSMNHSGLFGNSGGPSSSSSLELLFLLQQRQQDDLVVRNMLQLERLQRNIANDPSPAALEVLLQQRALTSYMMNQTPSMDRLREFLRLQQQQQQ
eukprot:scaffold42870_cov275-Amphora_coffeaeformis.AAC.1